MIGTVVLAVGTIYRTEDGGARWVEEVNESGESLNAVEMIDADNGVAVGAYSAITQEVTIVRRQ